MNFFKETECNSLNDNFFKLIGNDWMLITAGEENKFNTMTASWGGAGFLWNKNVVFTFVRPQRYTFEFMESSPYFSLSFFDNQWKKALSFCGSKSGRDVDKPAETGLTPVFDFEAPCFQQARLVLVCKKLYGQFLDIESMYDKSLDSNYKDKDYHKMYIGEVIKAYTK